MKLRDLLGTMLTVTPLPTLTYAEKYLEPFSNATNFGNFGNMTPIALSVFGDPFGTAGYAIVVGSLFVTMLVNIWIRQDDAMIPFILFVVAGSASLLTPGFVPQEWQWILIVLLIALPLGAIIYSVSKGAKQ